MFGRPKRFGFGPFGGNNGIVATPEQEAESARVAAMFGMGAENDAPQMQQPSLDGAFGIGGKIMPQQQAAPKRGGLFGNLGKIGGAMSGIGDILDDSPSGMQARELDYRQQQDRSRAFAAQQQAEAENRQWYKREQWKRDNRTPANNDTVADYEFIRQTLGEEEARKFLKNKSDPPRYMEVDDGRGGKRIIAIGQSMAQSGPLPTFTQSDWDNAGGATPGGSQTFRDAFAEWN